VGFELGIGLLLIVIIVFIDDMHKKKDYRRRKSTGDKGESVVAKRLNELDGDFVVEHNVYFGRTQIDHLVIDHEEMICYVIETKYWAGKISGRWDDEYWTQDKGGKVRYYKNPIKQNRYHCTVVKRYYSGYKTVNIVVFVGNSNVPKSKCIVQVDKLVDYIYRTSNKVSNNISNRVIIDSNSDWLSM
jgi:hypothetical protein